MSESSHLRVKPGCHVKCYLTVQKHLSDAGFYRIVGWGLTKSAAERKGAGLPRIEIQKLTISK